MGYDRRRFGRSGNLTNICFELVILNTVKSIKKGAKCQLYQVFKILQTHQGNINEKPWGRNSTIKLPLQILRTNLFVYQF